MPVQYERIRDSYIASGKSSKVAKKLAAMTYNAHRPAGAVPVGPNYEERARKHKAIAGAMLHAGMRR